jgi:ribosomal protein L9
MVNGDEWAGGYANRKENKIFETIENQKQSKFAFAKPNEKNKEKITVGLRGFKTLLRDVAKREGKMYHTLATDLIIAGIRRLERKQQQNKQ